jgi:hypothetical protein
MLDLGLDQPNPKYCNEDQDPVLKSMIYISANIMWKCSVVDLNLEFFFVFVLSDPIFDFYT